MSEAKAATMDSLWQGGGSPYAIGSKKFGMWLFIISDALTFSALLVAYTYVRLATPEWPKPFHFAPSIVFSSVMTFCLLSSSLTMVMAVHSMNHGNRKATVAWILATIGGGLAFVVLHMTEWLNLINNEHITTSGNEWGVPLFGGTFFALTGLHMTHVIIGVIYLGIIAFAVGRGKFKYEDVEVSGLYWHFVDLVWMFIFPLVYLMSAKL
ncbi:MAG TPA: cytochrome c oxidase subunit 3 [Bryobacteraceae bacterium]|jgi:cytochrome c oxidase subunit III|nr:cytochrome c oxidase subunit 3 [Bryobacteraceae bacterium]